MSERHAGRRGRSHPGQASLEVLAGIPALILAGLLALQLLVVGHALSVADGAAEAGALAVAADRPPAAAVRAALPDWASDRFDLEVTGGRVTVRVRPPSPFPAMGAALAVRSSAWARPPGRTPTIKPPGAAASAQAAGAGRKAGADVVARAIRTPEVGAA
jgi:hypothetical protein